MDPDVAFHLQIAAVVAVALLIVAVAVVGSGGGACEGAGSGDVESTSGGDVESALGSVTLMTYEQAATGKEKEEAGERCAICLSEYGEAGELVRVVPACGALLPRRVRRRRVAPGAPDLPALPRRIVAATAAENDTAAHRFR